MRCLYAAFFGLLAAGQSVPGASAVRATFLYLEGDARAGELVLRAPEGNVFRCGYDSKTRFENLGEYTGPVALARGTTLELETGPPSVAGQCYARALRRLGTAPSPAIRRTPLPRWTNPTEDLVPRGNLTYTGVVRRVTPEHLVLRLRGGAEQAILWGGGTRFLHDGARAVPASLRVNTRVFVRAGTNLDGEVEAYSIIWGHILEIH